MIGTIDKEFKSVYGLDELVAFDNEREDGDRSYGYVRQISFWKSDATNYAASYRIEEVNTKSIVSQVSEHQIQRAYA